MVLWGMPSQAVPSGYIAVITNLQTLDASEVPREVTTKTATITPDNSLAYIAKNGTGLMLVTRGTGITPGTGVPVSVTLSGVAADGVTALLDKVFDFLLQGPPPPPNATHFAAAGPTVRDTIGVTLPADPGTAVIDLA